MRPNVIKKQHNPLRTILQVLILIIMILCPVSPINPTSCNYAVKKVQIYSYFSKGHIRIENNKKIVAKSWNDNDCQIYMVTIDKHYMLLYHIKSSMFICWNKSFTKLVARLNPINLTYCKFEERPSILLGNGYMSYTSTNHEGKKVPIRFTRSGFFPSPKRLNKCVNKQLREKEKKLEYRKLSNMTTLSEEEEKRYENFVSRCAGTDFLRQISTMCRSYLSDFCAQMRIRKDKGHNITFELSDLCKNEWNKNNN